MKSLIICLICATCFTSCSKFLDVQPVSDLASETFWKTESDVKTGINSIYAQFVENYASGDNYTMWFEARAAETWHPQAGLVNSTNVVTNKLNSGMGFTNWNGFYKAIGRANYAMYFIERMNLNQLLKNQYMAEVSFLRARMYFDMITIWGDVPLVVDPVLKADIQGLYVPRTAKADVMNKVLSDLDFAIKNGNVSSVDKYKFTIEAAYALQAEVALWNQDWQVAFDATTKIVTSTRLSLVPITSWTTMFNVGNTAENIWSLKWSFANNGNNVSMDNLNRGSAHIQLNQAFLTKWKTQMALDLRDSLTYSLTSTVNLNTHLTTQLFGFGSWKFYGPGRPGFSNGQSGDVGFVIYRLADVYLMRAEAANKLNNTTESLKYLNLVRKRAGLLDVKLTDFNTAPDPKKALEDIILYERKIELISEGHRWKDLVRTGRAVEYNNDAFNNYFRIYGLTSYKLFTGNNDCELLFPVNAGVIDESKGTIVQSPCY